VGVSVTVIGGGAAGAMAALAARATGAAVELRSRGWGATALSSGAVDLAGDPLELAGDAWIGRPPAERNLAEMIRRNPSHPLGRVTAQVEAALERFCAHVPLYRARSLDVPDLVLPTDLGTWKSTFLAQRAQVRADLATLRGKRIAVAGFSGWPGFRARFLSASLGELARRGSVDLETTPVAVTWPADDADLALREPHELARLLDAAGAAERLGEALARLVRGADLVLLPPVLGFSSHDVPERIAAAAGVPVAEPLASDLSLPGLRLQAALDRALGAAGVARSALAERPRGPAVLATGRFLGGGVVREARGFREALFGLPVIAPAPADPGAHPFLSAGVAVDARLRPDGGPRDLFAAGAVLGGYDPIRERCGLGTAIVTGYVAGGYAAEAA
jgi:glycerol-3-phosphate dehydrogenase subunit B